MKMKLAKKLARREARLNRHRKVRLNILAKSGFKCVYCGVGLDVRTMTVDHVVPKSKGGSNRPANKVAACEKCNQLKGDKSVSKDAHTGLCNFLLTSK